MLLNNQYAKNNLTIQLKENEHNINVIWMGICLSPEKETFIQPVLSQAHKLAREKKKEIIMDFQNIDYMPSSTIETLMRILEKIAEDKIKLSINYGKKLQWQDISFSELKVIAEINKNIGLDQVV